MLIILNDVFRTRRPHSSSRLCRLVTRVYIFARVGLICSTIAPSHVNLQQKKCVEEEEKQEEVLWAGGAAATKKEEDTALLKKTHVHTWRSCAHERAGACEKQLPPPLREHRKLETIQRLHAGFSSKLVPSAAACLRAGLATRLDPQHIRQAGYL